jgi:ribose 5-phosphate isomerase B
MKVYIAADHAGYWLKEGLKEDLLDSGYEVEDVGNFKLDMDDDYPDFVVAAAEAVAEDVGSFGVVIGKSGNGESIAANKVKGIRAAVCANEETARLAREHNDANVISLGSEFVKPHKAEKIVKTFLDTPFTEKERHKRRILKITQYESS